MADYVKASVPRPGGNPGNGITPKDQIVIYDVDDILTFPSRDAAGVVLAEDITMKEGKFPIGVYFTAGTAEMASNSDGEIDAKGFKPSIKIKHPGNEKQIREFKTNWISRNCIVVVRYCNGKSSDIIGSPCNPCQLAVTYTGGADANSNELTFEQISKGEDIGIYEGAVVLEEEKIA